VESLKKFLSDIDAARDKRDDEKNDAR